jgi:hypothetical protein
MKECGCTTTILWNDNYIDDIESFEDVMLAIQEVEINKCAKCLAADDMLRALEEISKRDCTYFMTNNLNCWQNSAPEICPKCLAVAALKKVQAPESGGGE